MSKVKKPTLRMTNASTQICGRAHQRSFSLTMLSPEFGSHGFKFDRLLQHGIVSVPLHEIGTSHERAMFAGAAIIVPQIEVDEVDGLGERRTCQRSVLA